MKLRYKIYAVGLAIAFLTLLAHFSYGEVLSINKFGGLDTDTDELLMPLDRSPSSENILTDETAGLGPREGFVQFSTQSSSKFWVFPVSNGDRYLITLSSNILKATIRDINFTVILGTIDVTVPIAATPFGDRFYWTSKDGMKYWDTSVTVSTDTTLDFTQLVAHRGRCYGSGRTGDKRTIYVSKYNVCGDFALRAEPTEEDPTRLQVQGALDENITVLFSSFKGLVVWAKTNSFGVLLGNRRTTFESLTLSANVGSAYPKSFQDCDGRLRFLGTKRNIWEYGPDGLVSLTNGKERINNLMKTVSQGDKKSFTHTITTQEEWGQGIFDSLISSTVSSGDIVFTAFSSLPDDKWDGASPANCDYFTNPTWTVVLGSYTFVSGCKGLIVGTPHESLNDMYTNSTVSVGTWSIKVGDISDSLKLPLTGEHRYCFMCQGTDAYGGGYSVEITTVGPNEFNYKLLVVTTSDAVLITSQVHTNADGKASYPIINKNESGFFQLYRNDTGFGNPPILLGTAVDTTYSDSNFFSFRTVPLSGNIDKYQLNEIETQYDGKNFSTYTTVSFNIGSEITSWGSFFADEITNEESITYTIFSDTDSSLDKTEPTSFISKQIIESGETPTLSTGSFVTIESAFFRSFSTNTITIGRLAVNWDEGSGLAVSSLWADQRYLIGVAISSTSNNIVLVYDKNNQWQKWRGINASAAIIHNSDSYFGNDGGIFRLGEGTDDAGTPINSFYRTKRFYLSGPNYISMFDDFYMTTSNSVETLQTDFYINGINTAHAFPSYAMDTESGVQDFRLPFTTSLPEQAKMIEFLWTVNGTVDWRILNANLYYSPETSLSD
jgi:hypothetical protein